MGAAHGCLRVALQQSSVCGAALHSGVIDNHGGWLDVTRLGRKQPFVQSYRNGIQSLGYGSEQRARSGLMSPLTVCSSANLFQEKQERKFL